MTVQTTVKRHDAYGNGTTVVFPVPFYFLDSAHLTVLSTAPGAEPVTLVLGSDYTVAGAGGASGGYITTTVAPVSGVKISILRNVPLTQLTHYVENDPFPAASHERALDLLTMEVQQVQEQVDRSLTLSPSTSGVSAQLPTPLALHIIAWNEDATALQSLDPQALATTVAFGTARADIFPGDGVETEFTLTNNPGARANLDISVGGITRIPGVDYTWDGGTVVSFTTAPPLGVNVLIRYMQALPQGQVDGADVSFYAEGAGSVARTVESKLREVTVSVSDYGAKANGVSDDGPIINTAISLLNAAGGGELVFPAAAAPYKIDTALVLRSNVHLRVEPGATLDLSALAGGIAAQAQGSVGSAVPLSSSAARASVSVAVAAGAESAFEPGEIVIIYSERQPDASAQKDGEYQIIKSLSSGSITFVDGLWGGYSTSDTASIRKLIPVTNIRIHGGGTIKGSGTNDRLLTFYRCKDVYVENIVFEDGDYESLAFQGCYNFSAKNCTFYRSNNSGTGYGVAIYDGCQFGDVIGNKFIECRHGVSGGGNTGGYGLNRFINIIGNNAYGCLDSPYDGHSPCQYWNFVGNTGSAKNGANSDGITWQGLDVVIASNTLVGCKNYGVLLEPRRPEAQTGITVKDNLIRDSGGFGVYLIPVGTAGAISGVDISGNTVLNSGNHGILIRANTANRSFNGVNISGNTIISCAQRGVYVLSESAPMSAVNISDNVIHGSGAEAIYVYANTSDINNCSIRGNAITMTTATDTIGVQTGATGNFSQLSIVGNTGSGGSHGVRKYSGVGTFTGVWVADNAITGSTARIRGFTEAEFGENQGYVLFGSATYDPASMPDGAGVETDITVTGAAMGDYVDQVSFSVDTQGIILNAQVTASNTVTVRFQNETGGPVDLSSGTIRVRVRKIPNP